MREKWTTQEIRSGKNLDAGQPIGQRISLFPESYRPKLASSVRAIDQYNSIVTDDFNNYAYDNISYVPESENIDSKSVYSTLTNSYYHPSSIGRNLGIAPYDGISSKGTYAGSNDNFYDYATVRSNSVAGTSTVASETDTDKREILGSSATLIGGKRVTCWSWFTYVETVLCTISLSAGLGNVYRLTQTTLIEGGLPFLLAYVILALFIGFPILFLEIGLGQLVQEGFTKTWRAVPLLKGVTYVKFFALCLLSLYYPLYIGLLIFYLVWFSIQGAPPFRECTGNISEYNSTLYLSGQDCIKQTFLESPYADPQWFGIYVAFLMGIWVLISVLLCRRTRAYVISLIFLVLIIIGCFITLAVKAVEEDVKYSGLEKLLTNIDWSLLATSNVWYFGIIQVFFSTNIGMGPFVTNAGIIYSKSNAFWIALSLIFLGLIFGISSVVLTYTMSGNLDLNLYTNDIPEVHLLAIIYSTALQYSDGAPHIWAIIVIILLICSGLISVITVVYVILKAIRVGSKKSWSWWRSLVLISVTGIILGGSILLVPEFKVVRLLDKYVIGNLILLCTILEIAAIVSYYGTKRLRLDFEFLLGSKLPILNIILWWIVPIILLAILIWALATVNLTGTIDDDPLWLYTTGWTIVGASFIFIGIVSVYQIYKQDEYYTFSDKIKASTKPLRKWGPIDPIMRYNWVQWHSKAKKGVRDFTLKRRGTKEYTHSVKKNKMQPRNFTPLTETSTGRGTPAIFHADSPTVFRSNDLNQNNIRLSTTSSQYIEPLSSEEYENAEIKSQPKQSRVEDYGDQLRVTYCFDALNPPNQSTGVYNNTFEPKSNGIVLEKTFNNPLSNPGYTTHFVHETSSSPSEGYGTFRNSPYIIGDDIDNISYRRRSEFEESTEL